MFVDSLNLNYVHEVIKSHDPEFNKTIKLCIFSFIKLSNMVPGMWQVFFLNDHVNELCDSVPE